MYIKKKSVVNTIDGGQSSSIIPTGIRESRKCSASILSITLFFFLFLFNLDPLLGRLFQERTLWPRFIPYVSLAKKKKKL